MTRVLFVGDGKHDVGGPDWTVEDAFPAGGVVSHLVVRTAAVELEGSLALRWKDILRLSPSAKRGYSGKLRAALLLAERKYGLGGVVAVVDEDHDAKRRELAGVTDAGSQCPVVCGVAVRSIEAWTLGSPTALAEVLGTTREQLRSAYPTVPVEQLYEGSGKEELRPKRLLRSLSQKFARREDSLELREEVARLADVDELYKTCPDGFAPFAVNLRKTFAGSRSVR